MGDIKLSRRRFIKKINPLPAEALAKSGVNLSGFATTDQKIAVKVEHIAAPAETQFTQDDLSREVTLSGGLDPYQGPWTKVQAAHLLRRTTFGLKHAHLTQMLALGDAEGAVDAILNVPTAPLAPPINNYNTVDYTDPDVPSGQTWVGADFNLDAEGYRIESWRGWWLDRMIEGEANIQEKMTLFWHNHFATKSESIFRGTPVYNHHKMLREQALGNFKTFVKRVTLDPLMLYFLNGYLNNFYAPDENYSRELQELFTIGKESANSYTEDDVVVAARILTGWTIDFQTNQTVYVEALHDKGAKVFSPFYNQTVIQGNDNAEVELDQLLNMIFQKQEVSLFICREIYRFFVYYKIDDQVENDVIVPMAQIFRDNNYEILPVMRALLLSEHFYDAANSGCQIKNPLDLAVGILRNYNLSLPSPSLYDVYNIRVGINYFCGALQMLPGDPPNVAGWQPYRQSPGYYRMWVSSDTIRNRNILTDVMAYIGVDVGPEKLIIDHIGFVAQFSNPGDPNILLDDLLTVLLPMPLSPVKKLFLKSILLSGQASDYYWTDAWNALVNNPTDPMAFQTVWFRLASLHKYVMNLAEYQLI